MNIERIGDASKLVVHKKVESLRVLKTVVKQLVKTLTEAEKEK